MSAWLRPAGLLALALFALLSPLLLLLGALVLLDMGRPVLFRQRRSGQNGQAFEMVKFRTMRDARDGRGLPLPDADRVTALGRFLRRSRLDELPELINIARGDMDFVGPRPLLTETIRAMRQDGRLRGAVRPGLTGMAQVSGNTLLTVEEKLRFDLWYVRNRSAWLDAWIILRTLLVVVAGEKRINWHVDEARPPHWGG
ncbi:sugar transferase [Sphingobium chungbukense]|uniref:UDP-galactose phosphate transferase n=1 Tax=Sphingobium chungbukense TaxID=56193 RepID=A0A0M3AV01_9SPHN|nr:sugar transferase [Sphingobium chungbukense]KKW93665.1 UDP-galactose phosphate transferase [Sphingobium chungbukense]